MPFRQLIADWKRKRLLKDMPPGVLHDYYRALPVSRRTLCRDADIVALDFETTGLDPASDRILSMGLVEIRTLGVQLETGWHQLVRCDQPLPEETVVIHQITDDVAARGAVIELAFPELLKRLTGKVLLAHHGALEMGFLNAECQRLFGMPFMAPVIDTELLARRALDRRHQGYRPTDLRLYNLRKQYQLPSYKAHDAFFDALATAELFLCMVPDIAPPHQCRLGDVLTS